MFHVKQWRWKWRLVRELRSSHPGAVVRLRDNLGSVLVSDRHVTFGTTHVETVTRWWPDHLDHAIERLVRDVECAFAREHHASSSWRASLLPSVRAEPQDDRRRAVVRVSDTLVVGFVSAEDRWLTMGAHRNMHQPLSSLLRALPHPVGNDPHAAAGVLHPSSQVSGRLFGLPSPHHLLSCEPNDLHEVARIVDMTQRLWLSDPNPLSPILWHWVDQRLTPWSAHA